jgi:hypothetical protein
MHYSHYYASGPATFINFAGLLCLWNGSQHFCCPGDRTWYFHTNLWWVMRATSVDLFSKRGGVIARFTIQYKGWRSNTPNHIFILLVKHRELILCTLLLGWDWRWVWGVCGWLLIVFIIFLLSYSMVGRSLFEIVCWVPYISIMWILQMQMVNVSAIN